MESLKKEEPEENQQSVLGMRSDGDWMLYAGYNDQEKIRNVFSADLWYDSCADDNIFGVKNGMEYRYVETFFNNHYMGLGVDNAHEGDTKNLYLAYKSYGEQGRFLIREHMREE